jgi:tetratricopeptide (TPR) repeat protein
MVSLVSFYKSLNRRERAWFYDAGFGDINNCRVLDITGIAHNLNHQKHYETALKLLDYGFEYAKTGEEIAQFHVGYALNYEKLKDIEKCNYHCEEAVKLFHIGTYAYERLIINYTKAKDWKNALRICDMAIDRVDYKSKKSKKLRQEVMQLRWGNFPGYARRRKEFILKKIKEEEQ